VALSAALEPASWTKATTSAHVAKAVRCHDGSRRQRRWM
jgi:hypothetical protein